jgi:hypothetical protein
LFILIAVSRRHFVSDETDERWALDLGMLGRVSAKAINVDGSKPKITPGYGKAFDPQRR